MAGCEFGDELASRGCAAVKGVRDSIPLGVISADNGLDEDDDRLLHVVMAGLELTEPV